MAVWKWDGSKFEQTIIRRDNLGLDAYLYCPGPSLAGVKDSEIHVPGAMVFAINTAYPHIRPDVWMGLDQAECYDRTLWDQPFMKCVRYRPYQERMCQGVPIKESPNTLFLDTAAPPQDKPYSFILDRKAEDPFTWHKNTLMWAIDVIVRMGAKTIHFVGCDMGGNDYHDGRVLSEADRRENQDLYGRQVASIGKLVPMLGKIGVYCISCTKDSPLNNVMAYRDFKWSLQRTQSNAKISAPIKSCRQAEVDEGRICAITPTRGDRPDFLNAWQGMMDRQTRPVDKIYKIDYAPETNQKDIRQRIVRGVKQALADGFQRALIIEDDDYYRNDYVETMLDLWPKNVPLIGGGFYLMYHLDERCYISYHVEQLADQSGILGCPLHSTGFDLEMFLRFTKTKWFESRTNLDSDLWWWAQQNNIPNRIFKIPRAIISIKHGVGMRAGGCHESIKDRPGIIFDPDMSWLKKHTDPAVHELYANFVDHPELIVGKNQSLAPRKASVVVKEEDHSTGLTALANKYGTDKGSTYEAAHNYTPIYESFFGHLTSAPVRVLEIGIGIGIAGWDSGNFVPEKGPSLQMWRDYFHEGSLIVGTDLADCAEIPGVKVFKGNQAAGEDWIRFCNEYTELFDIIIDDGSHVSNHQDVSLRCMWQMVKQGGYYCIEDLNDRHCTEMAQCMRRMLALGEWSSPVNPNGLDGAKLVHWDGKLAVLQKA